MLNSRKCPLTLLVIITLIMVLLVPQTTGYAAETVKVGIYPLGQFMNLDADGNASGYVSDYLDEIAKYTEWNYEYVLCKNWDDAKKKLADGSINLVAPVHISEDREQSFYFPDYPLGVDSEILYVKAEDDRYCLEDYSSFKGMRVALIENNEISNEFMACLNSRNIDLTTVFFDDEEACFEALDSNKVDGVATGNLSGATGYKSVWNFGTAPYYLVTGKEQVQLSENLNTALGKIAAYKSDFQTGLYEKYYEKAELQTQLSFTRTEQDQLNNTEKLTVAFIPNRAPFSYIDMDGNISGISYDLIQTVADGLGIQLNCVMMPLGQTTMDYLAEHPNELVAGIMTENKAFQTGEYLVSDPFYIDDIGLVAKRGAEYRLDAADGEYILAVPKSYSALKIYLEENCPQFQVQYYKSIQECLNMVVDGQAQFAAQNIHVLTPLLSNPHYEDMIVLPTFLTTETMGVASLKTEVNLNWINMINKCIDSISDDTVSQFVVNHMIVNGYKTTFGDFLYKFRYMLFLVALLVIGIVLILIVLMASRKRHMIVVENKNHQLEAAIEKANRASESKGTFLAQMSHEIRTPMNAIIGLTTLAHLDINSPEKMEEYLVKVDGSSKILLGIINDVLDMSKIENHKLKIDKSQFDFKQLLSSITTIYYQQCKQKGITYEMKMELVTEEQLIGDSLRVNQIILNLLSNAVKFTPSGGQISVSVIQTSKTSEKVFMRFLISDTGCGMSEDLQERLFKPFEQEDAATARKHGGSGLGLAISKNLVDLMDGQISVKSKKDEGSTFIVDIPFGRVPEEDMPQTATYENSRVLIVDDDEECCEYLGEILKRLGAQFSYRTDGESALEELGNAEENNTPYDICIIDWKMPNMSGVEVTQQIRDIFGEDAVIIIISAYDLNEIEAEGRRAGADYFISKPLFQSTLNDVLTRINRREVDNEISTVNINGDYHFNDKRVLVAEDVVLNMEVAVRLLELAGIQVECAEDGKQALEMFEKSASGYYDAILMDINMPVMDGYESAKKIRASFHPDAKLITIYAMTANAFSEDVSKCMDSGMNGHIAKPIETKVLYEMLDEAFRKEEES